MSKPNQSSTVMQQRRTKSRVDYFPTPPWATEALCEWIGDWDNDLSKMSCLEPAAGGGHMVKVLEKYFGEVDASDLYDPAGKGYPCRDFLNRLEDFGNHRYDWVITNPPFVHAADFVERALDVGLKVAMLCRIAFLEGRQRHERLYSKMPPKHVLVFVNRVAMVEGRYDPKASSETCYAWFVWMPSACEEPRLHWI